MAQSFSSLCVESGSATFTHAKYHSQGSILFVFVMKTPWEVRNSSGSAPSCTNRVHKCKRTGCICSDTSEVLSPYLKFSVFTDILLC